jgi:nucleotidyltransferase/DNA polymerase involved in DNA repair
LAILFPELALELADLGAGGPRAVVCTESLLPEHKLSGGMRISEVCGEARALRVLPGSTVARARAQCASLRVCMVHQNVLRDRLEAYAEMALQWGATVSVALAPGAPPGILVDITGCAHLFGGEHALATRACALFSEHRVYAAIADGPKLAMLFARALATSEACVMVAPTGSEHVKALLAPLALELLMPEKLASLFARLGVHTLGALMRLPRGGLQSRLGGLAGKPEVQSLLSLLSGIDRTPLVAFTPASFPQERCELEYELHDTAQAVFLVRPLAERLLHRCLAQGRGVSELALRLGDQAHSILFPQPISNPEDLLRVIRSKLERVTLKAPIRVLALETVRLSPMKYAPIELFERRSSAAVSLVVAELLASLGPECVGKLSVEDTWEFRERSRLISTERQANVRTDGYPVEPTRLLLHEAPWERRTWVRHIGRVEGHAWWKQRVTRRDFYLADMQSASDRSVKSGLCFVEKRGDSHAVLLGYVD